MKFKFKVQQYQTDAADAVTSVFEGQPNQDASVYLRDLGRKPKHAQGEIDFGDESTEGYANAPVALSGADILANVRAVQRRNQIPESEELFCGMGACQLDVEMETGTGKTYVYTKTMLELNRLYGWCKFIVVVPSVAIREGVAKSLENTQEHFFSQYHKKIRFFIYDSDNLTELDAYSQSSDINCMVINMQAFNASMKEGAKNKAARIIFDERDEFSSRRPIDVIAANRPIVICDEPQKMGKKGGATQKGIAHFNPLFVLNYSATHKEKHDLVYALDALDAYNQKLVKRIEVKGFSLKNMRGTDGYLYLRDIVVSKSRAPEAVIEFKYMGAGGKVRKKTQRFCEGDSVYDASGSTKLEAYRGYTIASGNDGVVPPQDGRPGYVRFLDSSIGDNGRIYMGEVYCDSAADDIQRIQIRETILLRATSRRRRLCSAVASSVFRCSSSMRWRSIATFPATARPWATARSSRKNMRRPLPSAWRIPPRTMRMTQAISTTCDAMTPMRFTAATSRWIKRATPSSPRSRRRPSARMVLASTTTTHGVAMT